MGASELKIAEPFELPCGLMLPNRLMKASMAECMAPGADHLPTEKLRTSYSKWASGGWGMIMTGNVQIDVRYLGQPADVCFNDVIEYSHMLDAWKAWARTCTEHGTPSIVQINHPGRQAAVGAGSRGFFEKTLAPSPIPLSFGDWPLQKLASALMFGTPQELTKGDIRDIVQRFVNTAKLAHEAEFQGVEVHGAHGYLLAQFMSPRSNHRTDEYGGTPAKRVRIVKEIMQGIRQVVPRGFCVGLKLNSADHQAPEEMNSWLEQVREISSVGVDFIEVSGGSYENPTFCLGAGGEMLPMSEIKRSPSTAAREAFFLDFARSIRQVLPSTPLMLTGGFRTRAGMEAALADGSCDLIGLARPSVMNPALPKDVLLNREVQGREAGVAVYRLGSSWLVKWMNFRILGTGMESAWYNARIAQWADN